MSKSNSHTGKTRAEFMRILLECRGEPDPRDQPRLGKWRGILIDPHGELTQEVMKHYLTLAEQERLIIKDIRKLPLGFRFLRDSSEE